LPSYLTNKLFKHQFLFQMYDRRADEGCFRVADLRLGLDVGTTAIKAAAFDGSGDAVGFADRASETVRLPGGGSEQSLESVWRATSECLGNLASQFDGRHVRSIGICAQGDGFWALDSGAKPIRNAILWNDTRPGMVNDLKALESAGRTGSVSLGCHTALWPGTSALGWRWLRENEPEAADSVAQIVTCGGWIGAQLTGYVATDFCNASIPFLDLKTREYGAAVDALGCADARGLLSQPRSAVYVLGRLSQTAADLTGLPAGVPVSVATLDLGAMIVGMEMFDADDIMMILGTTAVVSILTDRFHPTDDPIGATLLHPVNNDIVARVLAPSTGTSAFDWFAGLHLQGSGGSNAGGSAAGLDGTVTEVPVGSNGVTFLPYLNGERAPFVAPDIRAGFLGMSAMTTGAELERAVLEGTALSLRHCFEVEGGLPDRPVQLTGCGSNNPVWCQIISDIVGQDILVNPRSDLGLWGAACIGAAAAGYGDVRSLCQRENDFIRYRPDPANHKEYRHVFQRYAMLSDAVVAASTGRGP